MCRHVNWHFILLQIRTSNNMCKVTFVVAAPFNPSKQTNKGICKKKQDKKDGQTRVCKYPSHKLG